MERTPITISFWARTPEPYRMTVLTQTCEGICGDDLRIQLGNNHCNNPGVAYSIASHYASAEGPTSDDKWHHYALIFGTGDNYSHPNIRFYIDGVFIAISTSSCAHNWGSWEYFINAAYTFKLGKGDDAGNYYKGRLENVYAWNRALTHSEVVELSQQLCE